MSFLNHSIRKDPDHISTQVIYMLMLELEQQALVILFLTKSISPSDHHSINTALELVKCS